MLRGAIIVLALLAGGALGHGSVPASPDIDIIVHPATGATRLSAAELAQIFTGTRSTWGGGKPIIAFNLPASHPLRVEFDRVVLDMSPDEVGRYWIDQRVRGGARPPRQIDDVALVARIVARMSGAIGYVPAGADTPPDVRVVARIRNRKVLDP